MDEIFGYMDGRCEVSLADSTMMWIVHFAMNKAQEKMKTKPGVIERLNEISKFYELAVMQLEGCHSFVHAEAKSSFAESNHEEVLADLREIKDHLQSRLKESELAISEKYRELTERFQNELKLRQALELKERELVSLRVTHGISHNTENDEKRTSGDGGGDFCELKTGADQQMVHIKETLEPQHDMLGEVPQNGVDRKKVEEMGSDIDILKQTMDLAFGKMHSALFMGEMGPKERQWKLTIEKDIMSILIKSFMREFQENVETEVKKHEKLVLRQWQEHWPQLMNEVRDLNHELATFTGGNKMLETSDSDCSANSSPTKSEQKISKETVGKPSQEERSHDKPIRSPQKVKEVDEMEKLPREEENNEDGSNYVAKLIKNHESIIRQKNEEFNWLKHGVLHERRSSSEKRLNSLKERFQAVTERLENLIDWNAKLSESLVTQRAIHDQETLPLSEVYEIDVVSKDEDGWGSASEKVKEVSDTGNVVGEEIGVSNIEKEYNTTQSLISEGMYGTLDEGLVEEFDRKSYTFDLEMLMQEHVFKCYLREAINQWNESNERNIIERKIRDDINLIVFYEAAKDISSNQEFVLAKYSGDEAQEHCLHYTTSSNVVDDMESTIKEDICMLVFGKTVEESNKIMEGCNADGIVREDIHQIVYAETLKSFSNAASSASRMHRENNIEDNFLDQLPFMITENLLKEDVCMVVLRSMLKEWKEELENYHAEKFIREQVHHVIMVETLKEAFLLSMAAKSLIQDNTMEDNCSTMMLNQVQGEENFIITLLESLFKCFEAEENLMLSAHSEIKEHSKQLDLGSEREDLHEHEVFEDLLTGEEQAFSSLTSKVENALQQLGVSKELLRELGTSLCHGLCDSESTIEEQQLKLSSFVIWPLLNLSQIFAEFEGMLGKKFEMMTARLEKMKYGLDPVIELVDCLRSKEFLYQKAFIKRCQNLQKAEAEVDLLGDQVDALLTLLEKIYVTLHQYAPALQQYFEVSKILELIKTELIRGAVHAASVVT